jgi:Transcriptional regulator
MDRRGRRTKKLIYNAFTELLLKEKYSKITIQEIIEIADIGRSTFYSHFETKEQLLKSICTDIFNEMHSKNSTLSSKEHYPMIVDILYHIKENKKIIKGVFQSESSEIFMNYFKDYFSDKIEQHILVFYDESTMNIPKDFIINHIYGSFFEMIKWWMSSNVKYTPEELAKYYMSVISPLFIKKYND